MPGAAVLVRRGAGAGWGRGCGWVWRGGGGGGGGRGRQIRDEGQAARIHCPGELVVEGGKRGKCNILVDEAVVETLLKAGPAADAALLSKYRKRLVEGSAPPPSPPRI